MCDFRRLTLPKGTLLDASPGFRLLQQPAFTYPSLPDVPQLIPYEAIAGSQPRQHFQYFQSLSMPLACNKRPRTPPLLTSGNIFENYSDPRPTPTLIRLQEIENRRRTKSLRLIRVSKQQKLERCSSASSHREQAKEEGNKRIIPEDKLYKSDIINAACEAVLKKLAVTRTERIIVESVGIQCEPPPSTKTGSRTQSHERRSQVKLTFWAYSNRLSRLPNGHAALLLKQFHLTKSLAQTIIVSRTHQMKTANPAHQKTRKL